MISALSRDSLEDHANILLVDDDEELRNLVREILVGHDHEIVEAFDYDSAVLQLQRRAFNLILLDITLPGKSGLDVLKFIRDNHLDCPVIMVTGTSGLDLAIKSVALGAKDYITKPCSPNYLLHAVENALAIQHS